MVNILFNLCNIRIITVLEITESKIWILHRKEDIFCLKTGTEVQIVQNALVWQNIESSFLFEGQKEIILYKTILTSACGFFFLLNYPTDPNFLFVELPKSK